MEILWVVFAADTINHAHTLWIELSTWAMDHACFDDFMELWFSVWIRNLGTDDAVDVMHILQLAVSIKDDKQVRMGQAAFLELNDMDHGYRFPPTHAYL